MTPEIIKQRPELGAVVALFAIIATVFSVTTPIFEASDEISHYPVVEHIATTGQLPVQEPGVETLWEQEGSQPPLYYMLAAGLTFWIDTSDLEVIRWRNPHAKIGVPLDPDNTNMVIHTEAEPFPWKGTVLAVHVSRLFSVLLGCITVVISYLLAREVWPDERWVHLLTIGLVAFNPMLLFITGSVNNDNLMILFGSWLLLLCARIVREGITHQRASTLATVGALATLTKISGWTFMPLIGLTLLMHVWQSNWRTAAWKRAIFTGLRLVGAWIVMSGWWYLRNWQLYNEFFGTNTHVAIVGGRSIGLWEAISSEWYSFWVAYWGWFGAVNILYPQWVYFFFAAIQIVATIGLITLLVKSFDKSLLVTKWLIPSLMFIQIIVVIGGIIRWTMTTMGSQGRLLFPVIGGVSVLTAIGLLGFLSEEAKKWSAVALSTALCVLSVATPFWVIGPKYTLPDTVQELPDSATVLEANYGPLELVGVETPLDAINQEGWVRLTTYWRLNERTDVDYSTFYSIVGRDLTEIGKLDTYPGAGLLPTSRMEPGVMYRDDYTIQVSSSFEVPTAIRAVIGVGRFEGVDAGYTEILAPTTSSGTDIGSVITTVAVGHEAEACQRVEASFASTSSQFTDLAIINASVDGPLSYTAKEQVDVALVWEIIGTTPDDWTAFVHLVDGEGQLVAQADGQPLNGDYPTSLWVAPCTFTERRTLTLPDETPAGEYHILIGLYNANDPSLPRMPATDGGDSFVAGTIEVANQ